MATKAKAKEEIEEFATAAEDNDPEAQAYNELAAAKSKKEVAQIWKKYYMTVGHRKLGRILVSMA